MVADWVQVDERWVEGWREKHQLGVASAGTRWRHAQHVERELASNRVGQAVVGELGLDGLDHGRADLVDLCERDVNNPYPAAEPTAQLTLS